MTTRIQTNSKFDINRPGLLTHYSYLFNLGAKLKQGLAISGNYHKREFYPNTSFSIIDKEHNFNKGLSWQLLTAFPYILLLTLPKGEHIVDVNGTKCTENDLQTYCGKDNGIREIYTRMKNIPSSWIDAIVIPYEKYLSKKIRYLDGREEDNGYDEESTCGTRVNEWVFGGNCNVKDKIALCLNGETISGEFRGGSQVFNDLDKELIKSLNGGQYPYVQDNSLPLHLQKARPLNRKEVLENIVKIMETTPGITKDMRKSVYDDKGTLLYSP